MGYGSEKLCYCSSYNEQGEISACELVRNNGYTYYNVFNFSHSHDEQSNSYNISSFINNNNNNNSSRFDSRILENVDNLAPEKKKCTICLENFEKLNKIINLSCLHMFHDECIKKWLKNNNYCPICKNEI